jgi:hypothetical protein
MKTFETIDIDIQEVADFIEEKGLKFICNDKMQVEASEEDFETLIERFPEIDYVLAEEDSEASKKTYYLAMVNGGEQKYVATESDIDCGGWVDADPEGFGFETKEEAEETRKALLAYAKANGWISPEILIEEHEDEEDEK